ncbi:MAG: ribosome-associated translation inhibitor RaiA [Muribaculaceae bacterium]|nr:ribosome-associated translation inhibitor RaiA [Muribaculaceae bacterium]MDE6330589.1 ribosome-associated translation inhibitor RaiA [Muribaculaceae bacterium]
MVAKINAVHFDITERLSSFIHKKVDKLFRRFDFIAETEVTLKVVKPETSNNKEAQIKLHVPASPELFASKTCDTFEEAVDLCLEALERQLEKIKEKK